MVHGTNFFALMLLLMVVLGALIGGELEHNYVKVAQPFILGLFYVFWPFFQRFYSLKQVVTFAREVYGSDILLTVCQYGLFLSMPPMMEDMVRDTLRALGYPAPMVGIWVRAVLQQIFRKILMNMAASFHPENVEKPNNNLQSGDWILWWMLVLAMLWWLQSCLGIFVVMYLQRTGRARIGGNLNGAQITVDNIFPVSLWFPKNLFQAK